MPRDDGYTTFSVRAPDHIAARIDQAAEQAAMSRSAYVLSWLPETYEPTPHAHSETPSTNGSQAHR